MVRYRGLLNLSALHSLHEAGHSVRQEEYSRAQHAVICAVRKLVYACLLVPGSAAVKSREAMQRLQVS